MQFIIIFHATLEFQTGVTNVLWCFIAFHWIKHGLCWFYRHYLYSAINHSSKGATGDWLKENGMSDSVICSWFFLQEHLWKRMKLRCTVCRKAALLILKPVQSELFEQLSMCIRYMSWWMCFFEFSFKIILL